MGVPVPSPQPFHRITGATPCNRVREQISDPYETVAGVAQLIEGDEDFVRSILETKDDRELARRALRVDKVAQIVAEEEGLDLVYLRGLSRRRNASRARAIIGHVAKVYGRIPYTTTACVFRCIRSVVPEWIDHLFGGIRSGLIGAKRRLSFGDLLSSESIAS